MICDECQALYEEVGQRAREAEVFARVRREDQSLCCGARFVGSETCYRVTVDEKRDRVWVGLYTPDRWLSESIEADLMFKGDKMEELLEEELIDQGYEGRLAVEHFRNDQKEYVFRSAVMLPAGAKLDGAAIVERVGRALLAYEATFRGLGDMAGEEESK